MKTAPTMPRSLHQTETEYLYYLGLHASLYARDAGVREEAARDLPALKAAVDAERASRAA